MTAYAGLRIAELAEGAAGPLCAMYFADFGAAVTKLERGGGDRARKWGSAQQHEAIFKYVNRGKCSMTLDDTAIRRVVDDAAWLAGFDAIVVHLGPVDHATLNIDWRALAASQPKLVVCEITDFGQRGPMKHWSGSELVLQALSGFTRYLGEPGADPVRVGADIATAATAAAAFQAIAAALFARDRTGRGQYVHVNALKALLSLKSALMAAQHRPDAWGGFHLRGPFVSPDCGWATKDGQVTFDFRHDQHAAWASFCKEIGVGHIVADAEYSDWRSTIFTGDRRHDLGRVYHSFFTSHSSEAVADTINRCGGISVKLQNASEVVAHPQVQCVAPFVTVEDSHSAVLMQVGPPFEFSRPFLRERFTAPRAQTAGDDRTANIALPSATASTPCHPEAPLRGVRVLDAGVGGVGPFAGSVLGMLGAEVVKLESPAGDFIRNIMPTQGGLSTTYMALNTHKRGLVLDMKDPAQRRVALELAGTADVFIENFKRGIAEKLGLGYEALTIVNPRLLYVSASGFGQTGPMADLGASDPHVQAFSGLSALNSTSGGDHQLWRWYGHRRVDRNGDRASRASRAVGAQSQRQGCIDHGIDAEERIGASGYEICRALCGGVAYTVGKCDDLPRSGPGIPMPRRAARDLRHKASTSGARFVKCSRQRS